MGDAVGEGPSGVETKYPKSLFNPGLLACRKCSSLRPVMLNPLILMPNNYGTRKPSIQGEIASDELVDIPLGLKILVLTARICTNFKFVACLYSAYLLA